MEITNADTARQWLDSWKASTGKPRTARMIRYAIEGLEMGLKIMQGKPKTYGPLIDDRIAAIDYLRAELTVLAS